MVISSFQLSNLINLGRVQANSQSAWYLVGTITIPQPSSGIGRIYISRWGTPPDNRFGEVRIPFGCESEAQRASM